MGKAGAYHYAVKKGRVPGIYPTWEEAQKQVKNFKDAKYKKFRDLREAQEWMDNVQPVAGSSSSSNTTSADPVFPVKPLDESRPSTSKPTNSTTASATTSSSIKTQTTSSAMRATATFAVPASAKPATAPSSARFEPLDIQDLGNANGKAAETSADEGWETVYTDGACKGNGKKDGVPPTAGVGVWWGPGDPRNIAERCPGVQTNNRAELLAIIRALEKIPHSTKPLTIHTDSEYCIKAFTEWMPGWLRRGWKTSAGDPVKNQPMVKYLKALLELRLRLGQDIELKWVKGHAGNVGNEGADTKANEGCIMPVVDQEQDWLALRDEVEEREKGKPEVGSLIVNGMAVLSAKGKGVGVGVKAAAAVKPSASASVVKPTASVPVVKQSGSATSTKSSNGKEVKLMSLDDFNPEELDPGLLLDDAAMEEMARTGNFDL